MLGWAASLTAAQLRAAIRRAVMEVNPEKARQRREHGARRARVERWAEDSGNAALAGRELPPAEVLAADQRVTAWARQLRKAGLEGGMDALRARAYLDILLGTDSRPLGDDPRYTPNTHDTGEPQASHDTPGQDGDGETDPGGSGGPAGPGPHEPRSRAQAGSLTGVIPPGFAGRVTLTITAPTLLDLADRPGELTGIGPIEPDPGANTPDRYRAVT